MCGAALLAPLALTAATSIFGGKQQNQGVQSYGEQQELNITNPTPELAEPTLGVDNSDTSSNASKKGKSALVINRNPGVSVGGTRGSGVNVVGA